jgi:hypothetical protein
MAPLVYKHFETNTCAAPVPAIWLRLAGWSPPVVLIGVMLNLSGSLRSKRAVFGFC